MCNRLARVCILSALPVLMFAENVSDQKVVSWVQGKVKKVEPKASDRRMDQIGWAPSITEALRYGRESGRPIFLFTHDGDISTGRC